MCHLQSVSRICSLLCVLARSVLKGYTIQHLPDGTVMVESIVIKVSSSAEDPNTKVLLLSWSYQVKRVVVLNCSLRWNWALWDISLLSTTRQKHQCRLKTPSLNIGLHSGTVILAQRQFKVQENLLRAKCPCVHCPVALATALLNSTMEARAETYLKQFVFHFDIHNLPPDEKNLPKKCDKCLFFFTFAELFQYNGLHRRHLQIPSDTFFLMSRLTARFIGELLFNREVRQASAQRLLRAHAALCVGGGV